MLTELIDNFNGDNLFLSNNYVMPLQYNGLTFTNANAAFLSQMCPARQNEFTTLNPSEASVYARSVPPTTDWDKRMVSVMEEVVCSKFTSNDVLRNKLLETGERKLLYGNTWHDNFWGYCTCPQCVTKDKHNRLGIILMDLRGKLSWQRL